MIFLKIYSQRSTKAQRAIYHLQDYSKKINRCCFKTYKRSENMIIYCREIRNAFQLLRCSVNLPLVPQLYTECSLNSS